MKKLVSLLGLSLFLSFGLHAGKATITGSASVSRAPEFVVVNLSVKSECHASPMEAMTANNDATARVQGILEQFINKEDAVDGVFTDGGFTSGFSKTIYSDGESKELCVNTFQQVTDIKYKTGNVKDFSRIFAQIQEGVLENFAGSKESEGAITYVTIDAPMANVCKATRKEMASEAAGLAAQDASNRFHIYAEQCGIMGNVEMINIAELGPVYQSDTNYKEAFALPIAGSVVMTRFQDIVESAQLSIEFEFPTTTFACGLPMKRQRLE